MENSPLLSIEKNFHSKLFKISIFVDEKKLELRITEGCSNRMWLGEYTVNFIETLTHKAGSLKKFNVFLNMLLSGLEGTSSSVIVDLESHNDLEKIRNKPVIGNLNTIYLILTYISEFDKIFYPLPLQLKSEKEKESITSVISYFQKEISELNNNLSILKKDKDDLIEENNRAKKEANSLKVLVERESSDKERIKNDLECLRADTSREIKILQQTIEDLRKKVQEKGIQSQGSSRPINYKKQENTKLVLENKILEAEIGNLKKSNKKNKVKIIELQKQLDDTKISLKERPKSVLSSNPETPCRASNASTRSRSSVKTPCNASDISIKLEKIVNLLALNEKHQLLN